MKLKHFLFVDFETYYSQEFSLSKMTTPEYIFHPLFAVQLLAVYDLTWPAPKLFLPEQIPDLLAQYPAAETIACSHNMLFDGAILAWKYGWVPGRLQDTLGMARALRKYQRYSLGSVMKELFGRDTKGDVIHKVKGMNSQQIKNAGLWPTYCTYALNDVRECAHIYFKLLPEFPPEERQIMDLVLRAALVPKLHADIPLLEKHLEALRKRKLGLLRDCGYDKAALMSQGQFQDALESLGVDIQFKPGTRGPIPAFAKSDEFMQELLEYADSDDEDVNLQVQALAAARLSFKSTIEETRAQKFLTVAQLPWGNGSLLPVPLRYGGAHTHRLSGEWGMNLQNLPRRRDDLPEEKQSRLRRALKAPPGHKVVAADLSQIEARIVACLAKQDALVEAFRKGEDVYASFASVVFNRPINKADNPVERFVGKTGVLGLGYGCGAPRFRQMLLASARQYNIPIDPDEFDLNAAEKVVYAYRNLFPNIQKTWWHLDRELERVINGHNPNHVSYFGPTEITAAKIILPNKMVLRYTPGDPKLYGAKILENVTQALARIVIMQAALRLAKHGLRFHLQSHDELVFAIPEGDVDQSKTIILDEMTYPPLWMPELPLAIEIKTGANYGELK